MRLLATALVAATNAGVLLPAHFAARPGWHVGAGSVHACPGVTSARCSQAWSWAATVKLRDCAGCLPHHTLASLPRDGIVIQISLATERTAAARRALAWPLQVHARDVGGLEGVPRRFGVYQAFGYVGRYEVYAFVFFGWSRPSVAQLAAANAELATVRLR